VTVSFYGQHGSTKLLVATQVVLSLQLPLAIIPLLRFASDVRLMGRWRLSRAPWWTA
jgi:manganese transport protein